MIIAAAVGILVGWSVASEANVIMPLIGIGTAMTILYLLKRHVKEIMEDERSNLIGEKTARTTFGVSMPLMAVTALTLILLSNRLSSEWKLAGTILAYSACVQMIIYNIAHLYHERKH